VIVDKRCDDIERLRVQNIVDMPAEEDDDSTGRGDHWPYESMNNISQLSMWTYQLESDLSSLCRVCVPRLGLQARVQSWLQTDPAVALYPRAAEEGGIS